MDSVKAIVLAAGKGRRLNSDQAGIPKVLRPVNGRPMLAYVLDALSFLPAEDVIIVTGYMSEQVQRQFPTYQYAFQETQDGTGDAVKCAVKLLAGYDGSILVCCGDMPLLESASYQKLLEEHRTKENACTILSSICTLPLHCGKILRDADDRFVQIIEERDCTPEQLMIQEVNSGVYVFDSSALFRGLLGLTNHNKQGEYYLTDVPYLIKKDRGKVGICKMNLGDQIIGINTPEHLALAEHILSSRGSV